MDDDLASCSLPARKAASDTFPCICLPESVCVEDFRENDSVKASFPDAAQSDGNALSRKAVIEAVHLSDGHAASIGWPCPRMRYRAVVETAYETRMKASFNMGRSSRRNDLIRRDVYSIAMTRTSFHGRFPFIDKVRDLGRDLEVLPSTRRSFLRPSARPRCLASCLSRFAECQAHSSFAY